MSSEPRENVPLAPHTTLGLGGPARYFWECADEAALRRALAFAERRGARTLVLGGGSNLVVSDAGFPGLVVKPGMGGIAARAAANTVDVTAGAGVEWDALVRHAVAHAWGGIECLSGIPGTVGGVPIQNVGAYGQEVAETLVAATCLDRERLDRVVLSGAECEFGYRDSRFKRRERDRWVVLDVTLRLRPNARPALRYPELAQAVGDPKALDALEPGTALRAVREAVLELRRRKSMVLSADDPNTRSVGSFFVNPMLRPEQYDILTRRWRELGGGGPIPAFPQDGRYKVPAAWLVEQAGFAKGYRRGGVAISTRHALALVNLGGTTAELLALARAIEDGVAERFGIRLEREPTVVD